jgi:hypothetical protein
MKSPGGLLVNTRWLLAALALVAAVSLVAFGAYRAGQHHAAGHETAVVRIDPATGQTGTVEVVRVDDGYRHWGFFPFGFIFPLFFFAFVFFVLRGLWWRGRGPWGGGPWNGRAEEWHRRQHDQSNGQPAA